MPSMHGAKKKKAVSVSPHSLFLTCSHFPKRRKKKSKFPTFTEWGILSFFPSRTFAHNCSSGLRLQRDRFPSTTTTERARGKKHLSPHSIMPFPHLSKTTKNSKHFTVKELSYLFSSAAAADSLCIVRPSLFPSSRVVFIYLRPSFASGKTGVNNNEKGLASPFLFLPPPLRDWVSFCFWVSWCALYSSSSSVRPWGRPANIENVRLNSPQEVAITNKKHFLINVKLLSYFVGYLWTRNKTRWGKRRRRGGRHSVMRVNVDGRRMEEEEEWWYRYGLPKKERTGKKKGKEC